MVWERWSGGQCWWEVVVVLETGRKDQEWGDARLDVGIGQCWGLGHRDRDDRVK